MIIGGTPGSKNSIWRCKNQKYANRLLSFLDHIICRVLWHIVTKFQPLYPCFRCPAVQWCCRKSQHKSPYTGNRHDDRSNRSNTISANRTTRNEIPMAIPMFSRSKFKSDLNPIWTVCHASECFTKLSHNRSTANRLLVQHICKWKQIFNKRCPFGVLVITITWPKKQVNVFQTVFSGTCPDFVLMPSTTIFWNGKIPASPPIYRRRVSIGVVVGVTKAPIQHATLGGIGHPIRGLHGSNFCLPCPHKNALSDSPKLLIFLP